MFCSNFVSSKLNKIRGLWKCKYICFLPLHFRNYYIRNYWIFSHSSKSGNKSVERYESLVILWLIKKQYIYICHIRSYSREKRTRELLHFAEYFWSMIIIEKFTNIFFHIFGAACRLNVFYVCSVIILCHPCAFVKIESVRRTTEYIITGTAWALFEI